MSSTEEEGESTGKSISISLKQAIALTAALSVAVGFAAGSVFGATMLGDKNTVVDKTSSTEKTGSGGDSGRVSLKGVEFKGEPDLGKDSAPIKVVEYTEFGCPFCSEWEGYDASRKIPIDQLNIKDNLVKKYVETGEVEFIQKNWAQPGLHPNSIKGHKAANCVYKNSKESKYWEYQAQLFDRRDQWMKKGQDKPKQAFRQISNDLGLDTEKIMSCYTSSKAEETRQDQSKLTSQVGRIGTPTFFIGNREKGFIKISGAQPLSRFEQAINKVQS